MKHKITHFVLLNIVNSILEVDVRDCKFIKINSGYINKVAYITLTFNLPKHYTYEFSIKELQKVMDIKYVPISPMYKIKKITISEYSV